MIFDYLKTKDKILDIGIGTGLSATGFHTSGLDEYGLDYYNEMLPAAPIHRLNDAILQIEKSLFYELVKKNIGSV